MSRINAVLIIGGIHLFSACTGVPQIDNCRVSSLIQKRISQHVHWKQGTMEDQQVQCYLEHLLQQELRVDMAVQIALLNNPEIQANFEELGIAQTDLVQAGLLQNPIFEGFFRFPNKSSLATNTEFSVTQGFLDIFLIPLRKKIAAIEFEKTEHQVANMVLQLAFDVQKTYYALQAEQMKLTFLELLVQIASISNLLKMKQYEAGNINELELQHETSLYFQAKLELSKTHNQIAGLHKQLHTLLGLRPSESYVHISNELPDIPIKELSEETLHALALSQRLDIACLRLEIKRISEMGAIKEWWAYTDPIIGVSGERDVDKARVLGPTLSITLPFFDHGQIDKARLFSQLKQSEYRLQALEIDVLTDVTRSLDQLLINRKRVIIYQNEFLPLQEKIVATSQRFYTVMGLSTYKLLQNKKEELHAKIAYTMALRDYWMTRVELDQAVGGALHK